MKHLALVLVAAALLLPGAAHAAACSPLNCAPSQFTLAGGTLVAYRHTALGTVRVADLRTGRTVFTVPGGFVGGNLLVHQSGRRLQWFDLRTGQGRSAASLPWSATLVGVSQDGLRAVAFHRVRAVGSTSVVVGSAAGWRQVPLPRGTWDFDALYGHNLFLIKYLSSGGYQVLLLDLSARTPQLRVLKDPHESGTIWGSPYSRLASPDGRILFTLYISQNGAAMVHELDLAAGTARCIDLPGTGDYAAATSWGLALSPDAATLWAVGPGYGRVIGIDVASRKVATTFAITRPTQWEWGFGTRIAMSPDGNEIALSDGTLVVRVELSERRLGAATQARTTALAYAPDGRLLTLR